MLLVKHFQVIKTWYLFLYEKSKAPIRRRQDQLSVSMNWLGGGIKPRALPACAKVLCSIYAMLRKKILCCLWLLNVSEKGTNWYRVTAAIGRSRFSVG